MKKLTEKYIRSYKIKKIISENVVELELPVLLKIHLVVNVSRIVKYQEQVKGQKKIPFPYYILSLPNWSIHHHGNIALPISNLQVYLLWQLPSLQHTLMVVMQQSGYSIFHDGNTVMILSP